MSDDRVAALADAVIDDIETRYEFSDELGAGATSTVYLASRQGDSTNNEFALKIFDREVLTKDDEAFAVVESEVLALREHLSAHPHIVRLVEVVCDAASFIIVTAALQGGELFQEISENGALSEAHAKSVFAQVALAVSHMHAHGIAHRDLKAENIVFVSGGAGETAAMASVVQLIDFGSSTKVAGGMLGLVASANYAAPEVVASAGYRRRGHYADITGSGEPYSADCDVWSLGVLAFLMLSKRLPFAKPAGGAEGGISDLDVMRRVLAGGVSYEPEAAWRSVSEEAKAMISNLLVESPLRLSMAALLEHPWCREAVALWKDRMEKGGVKQRRRAVWADPREEGKQEEGKEAVAAASPGASPAASPEAVPRPPPPRRTPTKPELRLSTDEDSAQSEGKQHAAEKGASQVAMESAPTAATDPLDAFASEIVVLHTSMTRDQLATVATRKLVSQAATSAPCLASIGCPPVTPRCTSVPPLSSQVLPRRLDSALDSALIRSPRSRARERPSCISMGCSRSTGRSGMRSGKRRKPRLAPTRYSTWERARQPTPRTRCRTLQTEAHLRRRSA